ncbi:hypothetical protein DMUE_5350 [Dictyocoela muelleri]|nr:hypothetical protein DMUE_5350 [Dictyocoela muelleri]
MTRPSDWRKELKSHYSSGKRSTPTGKVQLSAKAAGVEFSTQRTGHTVTSKRNTRLSSSASKVDKQQAASVTIKGTKKNLKVPRSNGRKVSQKGNQKRKNSGKLSISQCMKVLAGVTPFEVNKVKLIYFGGLKANKPGHFRAVLKAGGINLSKVMHVGFLEGNYVEILANETVCGKIQAFLCSFDGVFPIFGTPYEESNDEIREAHVKALKNRLASAITYQFAPAPVKRFGKILGRVDASKPETFSHDLFYDGCYEVDSSGVIIGSRAL